MISETQNTYVKLPEDEKGRMRTAKLSVRITVNVPKDMEKKASKFKDKWLKKIGKAFEEYIDDLTEEKDY